MIEILNNQEWIEVGVEVTKKLKRSLKDEREKDEEQQQGDKRDDREERKRKKCERMWMLDL